MQSCIVKFPSTKPAPSAGFYARRLAIYEQTLGAPVYTFTDTAELRIDVHTFGRDFVPDREQGTDEGYVLLTDGMSERRMPLVDHIGNQTKRRAELIWYVREPTPEMCAALRWLANLPFVDSTCFKSGDRVLMPTSPVAATDFRTFLFLTPVIQPERGMAEAFKVAGEPVEILIVNLISDRELAFIKADGLKAFLDLLDENDYPPVFDPSRKSYV